MSLKDCAKDVVMAGSGMGFIWFACAFYQLIKNDQEALALTSGVCIVGGVMVAKGVHDLSKHIFDKKNGKGR